MLFNKKFSATERKLKVTDHGNSSLIHIRKTVSVDQMTCKFITKSNMNAEDLNGRLNSWHQVLVVNFVMNLFNLNLRMYFQSGIPVQLRNLTEMTYMK